MIRELAIGPGGKLRVVDDHRGGALQDGVDLRAHCVSPGPRFRAADPARIARRGRDTAVEAGGVLDTDERQACPALLDIGFEQPGRRLRAIPNLDGDACCFELLLPTPRYFFVWVDDSEDHTAHARG